MFIKKITFLILFIAYVTSVMQAQVATKTMTLSFAYLGEMGLHPGAVAGIEYPILVFTKDEKTATQHQLKIGLQVGSYQQPRAFNALFTILHLGYEFYRTRTRKSGQLGNWFLGLTGGLGWFATIYKGKTYVTTNDGFVVKQLGTGHSGLFAARFYGGGKLAKITAIDLSWYASATYQQILAINDGKIHQPAIELGLRWRL